MQRLRLIYPGRRLRRLAELFGNSEQLQVHMNYAFKLYHQKYFFIFLFFMLTSYYQPDINNSVGQRKQNNSARGRQMTKRQINNLRKPMTSQERSNVMGLLKHDRQLLAGKVSDYNPNLGDRRKRLSDQIKTRIFMLAMSI
jgi:hypothetical protein